MDAIRDGGRDGSRRRGSVLALTLVFMVLVAGLAMTLFDAARLQHVGSSEGAALASTLHGADAMIACARARLEWELDPSPGGNWAASTVKDMPADTTIVNWLTDPSGATCDLACLEQTPAQRVFALRARAAERTGQLRATGALAEVARRFELVLQFDIVFAATPLQPPAAAPIVAFGPVRTLGAFKVDGRDYDADLDPTADDLTPWRNPGEGTPAISSTGAIVVGGASTVAATDASGEDHDGTGSEQAGVNVDAGATVWTDGTFGEGIPADADAYYGAAPGTLRARAQADGTYFTDLAAYNAYVRAANEEGPRVSSKVLYLEVPNGAVVPPAGAAAPDDCVELPRNPHPDSDPALVVIAGQDPTRHDVTVGPVHCNNGVFQGVLMADRISRMNGNGALIGQVVSWPGELGDTIGNGTFDVYLSKEVLGSLPRAGLTGSTPLSVTATRLLWREHR